MNDLYPSVLREVEPLRDAFASAGHQLYLVGGIVRDLHLGAPLVSLDFDMTTEARPAVIKALVDPLATAVWTQGEKFGTIGAQVDGRPYEITTHRAESYSDGSRKPEVVFGDDIEVDLSRRDFTLNAMAIRLADGELIDPFDGLGALERRELMTPIEPEVSFADDPLRILRAARFIARYDLSVNDSVMAAGRALIDRMSIVSAERIRDELDKLLAAPAPSSGFEFLVEVGAWPFVVAAVDVSSVAGIGRQLDAVANDLVLRRCVVFSYVAPEQRRKTLSGLRYSKEESRQILSLLGAVDVIRAGSEPLDAPAVRRLVASVGYDQLGLVHSLIAALGVSDRGFGTVLETLDASGELERLTPVLTGDEIMELLGLDPGPAVGACLKALQERRFSDGPLDRAGEVAFLTTNYHPTS